MKLRYFTLLFLAGLINSCNVLDKEPINIISDATVWNDENLADANLTHLYGVSNVNVMFDRQSRLSVITETAATPLFNDISGELSIAYHPEFKKWILLYFNSTRYDISFRTADHIIGEWSKPQKLVDGWQYSQLYGSYIHPISLKGNILYFIMSMCYHIILI